MVQVPGGVCQEATPTYLTATSKFCGTLASKTAAAVAPNCCNTVRQRVLPLLQGQAAPWA